MGYSLDAEYVAIVCMDVVFFAWVAMTCDILGLQNNIRCGNEQTDDYQL